MPLHRPVMSEEVVAFLAIRQNMTYVDCTFGAGGHTEAILKKNGPRGRVVALDIDPGAAIRAEVLAQKYKKRFEFVPANFAQLSDTLRDVNITNLGGVLYDLGYSTDFLQVGGSGLSFQVEDEPLDMRYTGVGRTAADILNRGKEKEIADILYMYGEERYSRRIARRIVEMRKAQPFGHVHDLVHAIRTSVPRAYRFGRINCATRSFQALRIAVNDELDNLSRSLESISQWCVPGTRIVVISFHSLEDRIVKIIFKKLAKEKKALLLTKKPLTPSDEEVESNPSSRSAKLRAIECL